MKKVLAFIGSSLKHKSNTYIFTKMYLDALQKKVPDIQIDIYTAGEVKIRFCKGCLACEKNGVCVQDASDDMGMLKQKMLAADLVVWGSPNYEMNVSGQLKTFLDRLYFWYHTLPMVGKIGAVVMTSGGPQTGILSPNETIDYMAAVLCCTGVKIVSQLLTSASLPGHINDMNEANKVAASAADETAPYLTGAKEITTDKYLEAVFQRTKSIVSRVEYMASERAVCEEKGILACNSFAEYYEKFKSQSKQ